MTQDEILRMAREAGLLACADMASDRNRLFAAGLANFAALVTAKEREACAQLCEQSDRYRGSYFAQKIRARGQP